jgi:LysM repeat protein
MAAAGASAAPAPRRRPAPPPVEGDDEERDEEPRRPARRPRAYDQHLGGPDGPDWERPRRYEAYPTIKTRVGLPNVPRLALLAGLVVLLAIGLYFLPAVLGLGSNTGSTGNPTPRPSSVAATPTPSPTVPPAPTPSVYTIKKGETLSKIATAHGLTLEELLAANPDITNPNRISEGQQIILPVPSGAPPDEIQGSAEPSAAP